MSMPSPITLHSYLKGISYPATRDELLACAQRLGADKEVLAGLKNIEPVQYDDPDAVSAAFTFEGETTSQYGHVTVYDQ